MISERYLNQIEEGFALKEKRPACDVIFADFPKGFETVLSLFQKEENAIVFNNNVISKRGDLEVIISLIHESRHAYQWFQINHLKASVEDLETLNRWKKEFNNYHQPKTEKSIKYMVQEIEIDAIAYTSIQAELIGESNLIIPEEIKLKVNARIKILKQRANM